MAHYKAQRRLHLADTRDQAAENAVQAWAQLTDEVGIDKVALIADSSNNEIDRLNARAQHLRAQRESRMIVNMTWNVVVKRAVPKH